MALYIYNTLSRTKQLLKPRIPKQVGLYVCGVTVYDYCHIGHARILITFDMVARYLRYLGYKVTYVRNITDIDDKIIHRANENQEDYRQLTKRFIKIMHEDERCLGITPPDIEPRATDHIPQMIQMIEILLAKDIAYVTDKGDVYYDISRFPSYGELAHQDLTHLQAGLRIDLDANKRNPLDFVLWKPAKSNKPSWTSPWGKGRPGWHIECSTMATHYLKDRLDIHGGGLDLQFPHHQNELAQSEAAYECTFVKYWMHAGHVNVAHEKMSKSLGNFFTIRQVLEQYPPEVIRYFILASHYRSPINYSTDHLDSAKAALARFYNTLRSLPDADEGNALMNYEMRFREKMNDDFNTPEALSVLFSIVRDINRLIEKGQQSKAASMGAGLKRLANILGLLQQEPNNFLQSGANTVKIQSIEAIITARNQARANKNWELADQLRKQLTEQGVMLEDGEKATTWKLIKD